MRTVKFRGKVSHPIDRVVLGSSHEDGEWVYGEPHLQAKCPHIHCGVGKREPVDAFTVGQFTGLCDADGKEIYEGDIMSIGVEEDLFGVVAWSEKQAAFVLDESFGKKPLPIQHLTLGGILCYLKGRDFGCRIVGNIHDNPEMVDGNE